VRGIPRGEEELLFNFHERKIHPGSEGSDPTASTSREKKAIRSRVYQKEGRKGSPDSQLALLKEERAEDCSGRRSTCSPQQGEGQI